MQYAYPIPTFNNELMHSLSPGYLARLRFDTQQLATLRAYALEI